MFEDTAGARLRCSSISLDDGADEAWLDGEPLGFCEGGIRFPSRWQFDPGTVLALAFEVSEIGERLWAVTALFLGTPEDMEKIQAPAVPDAFRRELPM